MRTRGIFLGLLLAACGGSSGGDDVDASADGAGGVADGAGADGGIDATAVDGGADANVAAALEGLRWEIPCGGDLSATVCACANPTDVTATMGGAVGTTYQVALRFRGVVEQKTYTGGTSYDYFNVGGADNGDTYNVYRLHVSSPDGDYYLNSGTSNVERSWLIDYEQTIPIDGGATVTLSADVKDAAQIKNIDGTGTPIVVPGVAPDPAAYAGQLIQMDVVSISTL